MLTVNRTVISITGTNSYPLHKNGGRIRRRRSSTLTLAKRKEFSGEKNPKSNQTNIIYALKKLSKNLLTQSAVAIFALGFVDAGYSGDWSRIGVISKESEELLKSAAIFVVPFCIFLVFSFSKKLED